MSRRQESSAKVGDAAEAEEPPRELPRWMRLYFYGMHGVTLDVLLSAACGAARDADPKLVGFSSLRLGVLHALALLALERMDARATARRPGLRAVAFRLVLYPFVYVALQLLIGAVVGGDAAAHLRPASGALLAAHYALALLAQALHAGMRALRYHPSRDAHPSPRGLPGAARFLFFGMHGLVDEVIFTAAFNLAEKSDGSLAGHTSLWSFLMYGSCSSAVERLYYRLHFGRGWGTLRRLPVYVCVIYAWELSWGLALRRFDACSWDYSHYPYNFLGLVTLLYLPAWVGVSLYQDVLSNVLLRVRRAEVEGDAEPDGESKEKLH